MSKEIAKKLIAELQTNEELKAKIAGITDPAEMAKKAVENGYEVTVEELIEAEKKYRVEVVTRTDELTAEELEAAAGGLYDDLLNDDAPDGHELFCIASYHDTGYSEDNNIWCTKQMKYFSDKDKKEPDKKDIIYLCKNEYNDKTKR